MCHHFRLRFSQDMHGHGVSKKAPDSPFLKACLLRNLLKRDLTTRGYHIRDLVAADCVDADQVGDLEVLVDEKAHRDPRNTHTSEFEEQCQGIQEQLM
jgi:hypothetical protein